MFSGDQIAALSQMSWLMKTAAIELRLTSLNRQRSHTQRLVNLLLDDQPQSQHAGVLLLCIHLHIFNIFKAKLGLKMMNNIMFETTECKPWPRPTNPVWDFPKMQHLIIIFGPWPTLRNGWILFTNINSNEKCAVKPSAGRFKWKIHTLSAVIVSKQWVVLIIEKHSLQLQYYTTGNANNYYYSFKLKKKDS